jgi:FkbM family methyltransferase
VVLVGCALCGGFFSSIGYIFTLQSGPHESYRRQAVNLYLKSRLVGSPLGEIARRFRWALDLARRSKNPELWEFYLEEKRLPKVLGKLLKSDSCGVDIGCHIGSFLITLIKYCPRGKHTAVEASSSKSEWLVKKFPAVNVLRLAAGDANRSAVFNEHTMWSGVSRLQSGDVPAHGTRSYEVKVRKLDDVLTGRIDFIKLDIEGGELAALRGLKKTIERARPSLLFECGSEYYLKEIGLSRRELFDFITGALDYQIFTFTDFLFEKGPLGFDEFRKCGLYPFRAFNFVALPRT